MKVLFINHEYPPLGGGGGVVTFQIAKELVKRHEIDILTSGFKDLKSSEVNDGITIYRVPVLNRKSRDTATFLSWLSFFPTSLWKGIKLAKQNHYDVINSHFAIPSGLIGFILSKLFNISNILSIHGGDIYDPSKKYSPHKYYFSKKIISYVMNKSDKIVAQSNDTKKRALKYYKVKKKIDVINLGLVKPTFDEIGRKNLELPDNDFLIISIGRIIKRKGLQYLLYSMQKLGDKRLKLLIIGEGPEKDTLKMLSKKLNLERQIKFLGFVSEEKKYQYLSVSDLFVLPSLHEGFGIVFLEAMHCGLPIITTDNGGQTDFLKNGVNGFLVPVGDVDSLAEKINLLYNDSNLRQSISNTNCKDVKNFYSETMAGKYEKLFDQARNNKMLIMECD
jgi:glycosyltransferase involved in cell wall biosynthesis